MIHLLAAALFVVVFFACALAVSHGEGYRHAHQPMRVRGIKRWVITILALNLAAWVFVALTH